MSINIENDQSTSDTYLVPRRHHARAIREIVVQGDVIKLGECDLERAVESRELAWLVVLDVDGLPIVEVTTLPKRVVAGVERATGDVELVGED
jgi:hypothetical protein